MHKTVTRRALPHKAAFYYGRSTSIDDPDISKNSPIGRRTFPQKLCRPSSKQYLRRSDLEVLQHEMGSLQGILIVSNNNGKTTGIESVVVNVPITLALDVNMRLSSADITQPAALMHILCMANHSHIPARASSCAHHCSHLCMLAGH